MSERVKFEGTVVRLERDGFGIIRFDEAIGSNTHGVFSSRTSDRDLPFRLLKRGMHVSGVAEVDGRDLAAVKSLDVPTT